MLHILSQTKDPERVQDHLNKCFEGIQLLKFTKDLIVTSMISSMGEQVDFNQDINPFENKKLPDRGYVKEVKPIENWLSDVEY